MNPTNMKNWKSIKANPAQDSSTASDVRVSSSRLKPSMSINQLKSTKEWSKGCCSNPTPINKLTRLESDLIPIIFIKSLLFPTISLLTIDLLTQRWLLAFSGDDGMLQIYLRGLPLWQIPISDTSQLTEIDLLVLFNIIVINLFVFYFYLWN